MPIIGAHVSAAGGLSKAISNAKKIGAECMQIFGSSPRTYEVKMPNAEEVKRYKEELKQSGIEPVFLHAAYLVNLASPNNYIRAQSIKNLAGHLRIAEIIGAQGLIFHIGSSLRPESLGTTAGQAGKDNAREQAMQKIAAGMKEVLRNVPGKSWLIMENTAGGGNSIGDTAEEIGAVLKKVKSNRVRVCIDTAHAFEARMIDEYALPKVKKFLDELDKHVGFNSIAAFHINDSKTPAGSHHDRHANIGQGHIGIEGFRNLAKDKRMKTMSWILEVPGFDDEGPDKRNVDILKKLC